jgi:hypothetical protein
LINIATAKGTYKRANSVLSSTVRATFSGWLFSIVAKGTVPAATGTIESRISIL